ncbi:hypothetical protein Tco_0552885 [Tanacetum coccineum]
MTTNTNTTCMAREPEQHHPSPIYIPKVFQSLVPGVPTIGPMRIPAEEHQCLLLTHLLISHQGIYRRGALAPADHAAVAYPADHGPKPFLSSSRLGCPSDPRRRTVLSEKFAERLLALLLHHHPPLSLSHHHFLNTLLRHYNTITPPNGPYIVYTSGSLELVRQDRTKRRCTTISSLLRARVQHVCNRIRPFHRRTALLMDEEARLSHAAWAQSMDACDQTHSEGISLRTTVMAQQSEITELQAADRRRQTVITDLLKADYRRQRHFVRPLNIVRPQDTDDRASDLAGTANDACRAQATRGGQ